MLTIDDSDFKTVGITKPCYLRLPRASGRFAFPFLLLSTLAGLDWHASFVLTPCRCARVHLNDLLRLGFAVTGLLDT